MRFPVGPNRYRLQRQTNGSILAFDQVAPGLAFVLTPTPALDGNYALALSGALQIRGGRLSGVVAPARTYGCEIEAIPGGTLQIRKPLCPKWTLAVSKLGVFPAGRFALLGLRDGSLLLVNGKGIHALTVTPQPSQQLQIRSNSPLALHNGDPDFDFTIDYQP